MLLTEVSLALVLLLGLPAGGPPFGDAPPSGGALDRAAAVRDVPPPETASDTVVVFVVWGSSNATNVGNRNFSPDPADGTAWEWYWRDDPQHPPRPLDDPFPSRTHEGMSGGGSAWPSFAVTYNALGGGALDGPSLFMTSVADGGSGPRWMPGREYFEDGVQTITGAMNKATAEFPGREVTFGGVLWMLSPNLSGSIGQYPWDDYRADLRTLLQAYGDEVASDPLHAGFGGRFYLVNTIIPRSHDYTDPQGQLEADHLMDLEASVCGEFAYCSPVQESVSIKESSIACGGGNCDGWYSGDLHWGQRGLNRVGEAAAEVAAAYRGGGGGDNSPPTAAFAFDCTDLECTFSDQSSDPDGSIVSRAWAFGDGGTSTATNPTHTYAAGGSYAVTLTVTDDDGASDATSRSVSVSGGGSGGIALSVSAWTRGPWVGADLSWSPADGGQVDVYRNGEAIETSADTGSYTDRIGRGASGSFTYQVCETDTAECSNEATVSFLAGAMSNAWASEGVVVSPNPLETEAVITYTLAERGDAALAVFDLLGRRVAVLAEGTHEAGVHHAVLDATALPSGVYIYRLRTEEGIQAGRLTLSR